MRLEEICTVFTDGDWIESKDQSDDGIRLIQTGNIGEGIYLEKEARAKYISEEIFGKLKCTEIFPGDILVSRLPDPVGRACIIPEKEERMITAVDCTICRPNESIISKEYLCYFMRSSAYYKKLLGSVTGTTRKRISRKNLGNVELEVPSKERQMDVVEQLDCLVKVIESRKQELQLLDTLIKARFVEMFSSIREERLLGEISEFVTVGIANSATHAYAESGIPMLRNQNIKENYLDDSDLIYIKPEFAAKYDSKCLKQNDIIVMRTGYPGVACLVPEKYEGCQTFTTLIVRLKPNNNPSYVCSYINSDFGKKFINSEKVGVAQQNVGAKSLAKMPIKIAPKEIQDEFATFVDQVDKSKVVVASVR
nr:MAG TPA: hypothetical protein [Caudoviricetes sp.]